MFLAAHPLCGMRPNRQHPVMSQCFDISATTLATVVDHVVPAHGDAEHPLFWDEAGNWQALCAHCHNRKTRAGL